MRGPSPGGVPGRGHARTWACQAVDDRSTWPTVSTEADLLVALRAHGKARLPPGITIQLSKPLQIESPEGEGHDESAGTRHECVRMDRGSPAVHIAAALPSEAPPTIRSPPGKTGIYCRTNAHMVLEGLSILLVGGGGESAVYCHGSGCHAQLLGCTISTESRGETGNNDWCIFAGQESRVEVHGGALRDCKIGVFNCSGATVTVRRPPFHTHTSSSFRLSHAQEVTVSESKLDA